MDYAYTLLRKILFKIEPESAHNLTIKLLKLSSLLKISHKSSQPLNPFEKNNFFLPNKIGLAAGFDKNAEAIKGLLNLGFGFVEIGTVTPKPQLGNPKPRLFRLQEDMGVINRMGFNNHGADIIAKRLDKYRSSGSDGVVGVNIGANKDSEDRIKDYALCAEYFLDTASYFTANVSSPNTPGLRNLQNVDFLRSLLEGLLNITQKKRPIPILLKISPDQQDYNLEDIINLINELPITGIIATNTTVERPDLKSPHAIQNGGLSGKPLFEKSTKILKEIKKSLSSEKVLIGVGGIASGQDAKTKIDAGADAIQLYSNLIYKGPSLIKEIQNAL